MTTTLFATATASVHDEPLATITVNGTNVWRTISSEDGKWLALETNDDDTSITHAHLYDL